MSKTEGAAPQKELNGLHKELAKELTDLVKNGETVWRGDRKVKVRASAAILGVACRFLKDNNVECSSDAPTAEVGTLTDAVAKFRAESEDDEAPTFPI
jgi:hypothetical protein